MFETIWNSQSVLSANNDVYQLHFVRWRREEEWTPWNTILLTLDEADSHLKLQNLELVIYHLCLKKKFLIFFNKLIITFKNYGEPFVKKIKQKHVMAKNYFSKLPGIADYLRKIEIKGDFHLPSLTGIKITN